MVVLLFFVGLIVQFETPLTHASQPDFVLSPALEAITLRDTAICDGGRISYEGSVNVYIVGENGFSGTVDLSAFVTPSGPTVSLDMTSVYLSTLSPYGEVSATIRLEQAATSVEYFLNVTGTSTTPIHSVNVTAIPYNGPFFGCPNIPYSTPSSKMLGLQLTLFYIALPVMIATTLVVVAIIASTRRKRS